MTDNQDKWQQFATDQQDSEANTAPQDLNSAAHDEQNDVDQRDPAIIALETQLSETHDKLLRLQAEFDNFRRRAERDVEQAHKFSSEKILKAILPVADSLEKSIEHEKDPALVQGVQLTLDILIDVLKKHHVQVIDPQGEAFNPSLHEAMATEIVADVKANTVVKVFQKGYVLHDRLIRPAFVIVAKQA